MLSRLVAHAEKHPAPIASPWKIYVSRFNLRYMTAALLAMVLSGGSAALAAEGALPGDVLYPVKIYINEPVQSAFIVGDVSRARFETKKAVRRLEEIETLASQGRLNQTAVEVVNHNFKKSADEFTATVQEVEATASSTKTANVRVEFETKLKEHSDILSSIEKDKKHSQGDEVTSLRKDVEERADASKAQREEKEKSERSTNVQSGPQSKEKQDR